VGSGIDANGRAGVGAGGVAVGLAWAGGGGGRALLEGLEPQPQVHLACRPGHEPAEQHGRAERESIEDGGHGGQDLLDGE
jgi:hypothetical protein